MSSRPAEWLRRRLPPVLSRNFRLKALALGVALVCWTVVVYASNPPDTRTFNVPVPSDNLPSQFKLDPDPGPISIRIRGTRDHLDAFQSSSLTVQAAFDRVKEKGAQDVPLTITNSDRNVELDQPPTSVRVSVDANSSVSVPVTVNITAEPPAGYGYDSKNTTVSPPAVTVYGPSQKLQDLHAFVDVSLASARTTFQSNPKVVLYQGPTRSKRVSYLDVEPVGVTVTVQVQSFKVPRTSAVVPNLVGSPGTNRIVSAISVSPQYVVLFGPQELLNNLDRVTTDPIRLTGLLNTVRETVHVTVPTGVQADPGQVTVTITITVLPAPTAAPSPTATPTPSPTPAASPTATP